MALTTAASNTVDLSEDNDNAASGNLAAAPNLPSSNPVESFERSCDNPECSAPRLISLVPKRDTSEFVTEPKVVHQPTIINGFTTVFQIDGFGTRMEDIMNETADNSSVGESYKPKTVFRVVPNTHAHIVNYVVVDAAGETMKKIKENDPDTMSKLLVSQRLSAEQMLKKLIGKALETQSRGENQGNVLEPETVPVTTPIAVSKSNVPPGVTLKLLSPSDAHQATELSTPTAAPKNKISIKTAAKANKTLSSSTSSAAKVNASSSKQIPKSFTPKTQKIVLTPPQPSGISQISPNTTNTSGRIISTTRPVVWQAVSQGITSKCTTTPFKPTPPRTAPEVSPRSSQSLVTSPATTSSTLNTSASQQSLIKPVNSSELLDVEKSISAISIPVNRNSDDYHSIKQQSSLKRKSDLTTAVPESIKRLRPRSPPRIQNPTPLAGNVTKLKECPPVTRKLPMLPKFQKAQVPQKSPPLGKGFLIGLKSQVKPIGDEQSNKLSDVTLNKEDDSAIDVEKPDKPSTTGELDTSVRRKTKPLMGPASKMKALKEIADAKTKEMQNNARQTPLISEPGPETMKIGETIITRTGSLKGAKESVEPVDTLTKPCSVAVTDIAKSNVTTESDSDSKTKRSKVNLKSLHEEPCNIIKPNSYEAMVNRYRGRWTIKKDDEAMANRYRGRWTTKKDEESMVRKSFSRATRSSPKTKLATAQKPEGSNISVDDISDSTLLTTPSAPSRVLRVVLPSRKNGIVNNPSTSPHPNLKISSVISGGTPLAGPMGEVDNETAPIIINDDSSGSGIEQLQKELADLRRTVARLTQGKNV